MLVFEKKNQTFPYDKSNGDGQHELEAAQPKTV